MKPQRPVNVEIFGHNGADLTFLTECLEGGRGDARRIEAAPLAAKFIRAALAQDAGRITLAIIETTDLPRVPPDHHPV